jgi:hypothetical protein
MARPTHRRPSPKRIAIVGDGITEKWYFQQLRASEHSLRGLLTIEPKLPKSSGFRNCIASAESFCRDEYDEVHCLIDYDQVLAEGAEAEISVRMQRLSHRYENRLHFYILRPCFEIWLLLHFQFSTKEFNNCEQVEKVVATYIPGYNKSNKFWESTNVYSLLRKQLFFEAVKNAFTLERKLDELPNYAPRAEIFKLFINLLPKSEEEKEVIQKLFQ